MEFDFSRMKSTNEGATEMAQEDKNHEGTAESIRNGVFLLREEYDALMLSLAAVEMMILSAGESKFVDCAVLVAARNLVSCCRRNRPPKGIRESVFLSREEYEFLAFCEVAAGMMIVSAEDNFVDRTVLHWVRWAMDRPIWKKYRYWKRTEGSKDA